MIQRGSPDHSTQTAQPAVNRSRCGHRRCTNRHSTDQSNRRCVCVCICAKWTVARRRVGTHRSVNFFFGGINRERGQDDSKWTSRFVTFFSGELFLAKRLDRAKILCFDIDDLSFSPNEHAQDERAELSRHDKRFFCSE